MVEKDRIIDYTKYILIIAVIILAIDVIIKPRNEPFTELFFTNPSQIQHEVKVNEPFYVNFTVKNHEFKDLNYSYVIALEYQNQMPIKTIDMANGSFSLNHNETIVISEKLTIQEQYDDRIKVSVLLYKDEAIEPYRDLRYWINVTK